MQLVEELSLTSLVLQPKSHVNGELDASDASWLASIEEESAIGSLE